LISGAAAGLEAVLLDRLLGRYRVFVDPYVLFLLLFIEISNIAKLNTR
jgi:hypothetical protein